MEVSLSCELRLNDSIS